MLTRSKKLGEQQENALKHKVENGKTASLVDLGLYYFAKNQEVDAVKQWRQAAEKGDTQAASYLAIFFFTQKNFASAKEWAQKAANKGNKGPKEFLDEIEATKNGLDYAKILARKRTEKAAQNKLEKEKKKQAKLQAERKKEEAAKYNVPVPYVGEVNPKIPPDAKKSEMSMRGGKSYIYSWERNGRSITVTIKNDRVTLVTNH